MHGYDEEPTVVLPWSRIGDVNDGSRTHGTGRYSSIAEGVSLGIHLDYGAAVSEASAGRTSYFCPRRVQLLLVARAQAVRTGAEREKLAPQLQPQPGERRQSQLGRCWSP